MSQHSALPRVRVGFIPLTDCAPLVMAVAKGYDRRHGIEIVLSREPSWAAIRDKLLTGQLDAAHALYGLVYGVQMGIGGPRQDMAVLMTLNRNGQAITLSRRLADIGVSDGPALARHLRAAPRRHTFAQTFPTGTHALWLNYWLASHGIHPFQDINNVVVPPPQMAGHLAVGNLDGFCAGEPWNTLAIKERAGFTAATSQDIWPDHPEKVLACGRAFAEGRPDQARALVMAVLEAARHLDTPQGRSEAATLLAGPDFVNVPVDLIEGRLHGQYLDGLGRAWQDAHAMHFFDDGQVTFPWLSDGMWFLTQHYRWGMLAHHPDYLDVARQVNRIDLYREAAAQLGVAVPESEMRSATLMDGRRWDGKDPAAYAEGFPLSGSAYRQAA
ncbi:MAG: ABC transporter substrate-binding protein [Thiobacillaceae bacterium]|jgi:nitrate/nitrite transport system substrate-binding protein|nr:ABC transporter substrate-binding protein [Thiobacillaceae bacterium]